MARGKTEILTSGQGLTNSFAYTSKVDTIGFNRTAVTIEVVHVGSGVQYTVRGFPVEGFAKSYSITSGTILTSGASKMLIFGSDPYEQIDVGLKAVQTAQSGAATVYVVNKRR